MNENSGLMKAPSSKSSFRQKCEKKKRYRWHWNSKNKLGSCLHLHTYVPYSANQEIKEKVVLS